MAGTMEDIMPAESTFVDMLSKLCRACVCQEARATAACRACMTRCQAQRVGCTIVIEHQRACAHSRSVRSQPGCSSANLDRERPSLLSTATAAHKPHLLA